MTNLMVLRMLGTLEVQLKQQITTRNEKKSIPETLGNRIVMLEQDIFF